MSEPHDTPPMFPTSIRRPVAPQGPAGGPGRPPAVQPFPLPLLRLGFRPFYLLAAAFAVLSVPLWIAQVAGLVPAHSGLPGALWHAHEMLFGFALAVITGFLFTATRNWTGLPTPSGWPLAGLCALWIAARVLNAFGPVVLAAIADFAFILLVSMALGKVLYKSNNHRNFFVLAVLSMMLVAAAMFHLALLGRIPVAPLSATHFAAFVIAMLATVIGGRVIPSFTANALFGVRQFRNEQIDLWAIALTGAAFLLYLGQGNGALTAAACAAAALMQAVRLIGWNPWATRGVPLLWVLHLAYAWIPASLLLLGGAALGRVPPGAAFHALTVGALGGLIIGMITRTALGHTARPLVAGRIETAAYLMVTASAVLRIAPMLTDAVPYLPALTAAAVLWSGAFALYLVKYTPLLMRARPDGRDG
jgi:uncharacterized protein involved in response to NO